MVDYECPPWTTRQCEQLMLTDDKLYRRAVLRSLMTLIGGRVTAYYIPGTVTPGTFVVTQKPGILHRIIFNNTQGTSLTIVDTDGSGTSIVMGVVTLGTIVGTHEFGFPFTKGLEIVVVGSGTDAIVVYE